MREWHTMPRVCMPNAVLHTVFGALLADGTLRKTCQPLFFQNLRFGGHKRSHGIKFQSVLIQDGLFAWVISMVGMHMARSMMCSLHMGTQRIHNQCIFLVDTETRNPALVKPDGTRKCQKFGKWLSGDFVVLPRHGRS